MCGGRDRKKRIVYHWIIITYDVFGDSNQAGGREEEMAQKEKSDIERTGYGEERIFEGGMERWKNRETQLGLRSTIMAHCPERPSFFYYVPY